MNKKTTTTSSSSSTYTTSVYNGWLMSPDGEAFSLTDDEIDQKKYVGFVYIITDTKKDMKYIGKKLFHSRKTRIVKGKKKKYTTTSDWRKYFGSNKLLLQEKLDGEKVTNKNERFIRTILHICISKAECSFLELKEQILHDALLREDYYNEWVMVRIRKDHLKSLWITT